ncbi:hypothetical protein Vretimale_7468, partial [Volvox reticuliferus]
CLSPLSGLLPSIIHHATTADAAAGNSGGRSAEIRRLSQQASLSNTARSQSAPAPPPFPHLSPAAITVCVDMLPAAAACCGRRCPFHRVLPLLTPNLPLCLMGPIPGPHPHPTRTRST